MNKKKENGVVSELDKPSKTHLKHNSNDVKKEGFWHGVGKLVSFEWIRHLAPESLTKRQRVNLIADVIGAMIIIIYIIFGDKDKVLLTIWGSLWFVFTGWCVARTS